MKPPVETDRLVPFYHASATDSNHNDVASLNGTIRKFLRDWTRTHQCLLVRLGLLRRARIGLCRELVNCIILTIRSKDNELVH